MTYADEQRRRDVDNNRMLRNKQYVFIWLSEHPCVDCNEPDPVVSS